MIPCACPQSSSLGAVAITTHEDCGNDRFTDVEALLDESPARTSAQRHPSISLVRNNARVQPKHHDKTGKQRQRQMDSVDLREPSAPSSPSQLLHPPPSSSSSPLRLTNKPTHLRNDLEQFLTAHTQLISASTLLLSLRLRTLNAPVNPHRERGPTRGSRLRGRSRPSARLRCRRRVGEGVGEGQDDWGVASVVGWGGGEGVECSCRGERRGERE
mgnify:CR=1 FL=1